MPSSYIFANNLRVHYLYWRSETSFQHPVVLLHGLASNARIWELVAPLLAQAGLAGYAPDGRGHGLTDKPDGDYGFETFNRDLLAFMEGLSLERPILVGHSWGAHRALEYAARMSFGPRAPAAVILVDGGVGQLSDRPGATWESTAERLAPPKLAGTPLASFIERVRQNQLSWQIDDQALSIILANFEIMSRESFQDEPGADVDEQVIVPRLTFEHHMQILKAMWEFPAYERLARVRCPVLAILSRPAEPHSSMEAEFMAFKEASVARMQNTSRFFRAEWMQDTIHDSPLQRPAQLAERITLFCQDLP